MSQPHTLNRQGPSVAESTWFITGIGRGLGHHLAEEVLRRGGRVAGTVRQAAQAEELREKYPERLWVGELELSDFTKIPEVFAAAVRHFGRIHAVVNSAGYSLLGAAEELDLASIRRIVDINLIGSVEVARAAVAHMRPLGGGRLLQVSSSAGQAAFAGLSLYCASKWGIEGFIESLAQEVAGFGVQTTLVQPGTIRTGFGSAGVLSPAMEVYRESPAGMMRRMSELGYVAPGDPAKMAKAVVDTYEAAVAPPRLVLGADAYAYLNGAISRRLEEVLLFRNLETDCDEAPEADGAAG